MPILNIPLSKVKLKEYKCICGNNNFEELESDNPFGFKAGACRYCGFFMNYLWFDQGSFLNFAKKYHRSSPNYSYFLKENMKHILFKKYIPLDKLSPKTRHLDIGSGLGRGIQMLGMDSLGLELAISHYIYSKFEYGFNARNTLDIKDASFDLITMFSYMAYIPEPDKYLQGLYNKLNDDGLFILTLPIYDRPTPELLSIGYAIEYFSFFTYNTIKNLLGITGFEIVKEDLNMRDMILVCKKGKQQPLKRIHEETSMLFANYCELVNSFRKRNYDEMMELNPNCLESYFMRLQANITDFPKVFQYIEDLTKKFPDNLHVNASIGTLLYNHQRYNEAITYLKKAISILPAFDIAYTLAMCYYDTGIFDKAVELFKYCEKINPVKIEELMEKKHACYWAMREL